MSNPDRLRRAIAILDDLVAFPSISSDSNLPIARYLADRLTALGATVQMLPDPGGQKANIFATFGPAGDGGIVLSGHTDVVPVADQNWATDPFRLHERDGRLFGRGTCDMKGFVAAIMATASDWSGAPLRRPLHLALTHDEEVGCLGAAALVDWLRSGGLRPAMALVGEPTGMGIVEGHKGCNEYTTVLTGLEGHGSAPDNGVNAAEYALLYAARLVELREELKARAPAHGRFDPPWTTINLGRIAGGTAHNVIPGRAEIDWDLRPVSPEDAEFVLDRIDRFAAETLLPRMQARHPEAGIARRVIGETVGFAPAARNAARDLLTALTGANAASVVAFGTEAGLFQSLPMDVAICGPGDIAQAHKPDEFLEVAQLAACLSMLEGLTSHLQ